VVLQLLSVHLLLTIVLGDCPDGSIEGFDGQTCYLYERFPAQFVTAERLCRDSHGHLASVGDLFVNDFIAQGGVEAFEVMQVDNFWIGADDLEKRDRWEWIDGTKFGFTNWASKEPTNDSRSFCSALSLPEGLWYAKSCYESKPYVCKLPASSHSQKHKPKMLSLRYSRHRSPNTTQPTTICNDGWSYLNSTNLCYKVVKDASDCYRPNTQEASIHTKAVNNFAGEMASKLAEKEENVRVRLSLAQYHPSKKSKLVGGNQVKPWLSPHKWGVRGTAQQRQYFNTLKHSSLKEKHDWSWFDGSSVDFKNWAKSEPRKFEEFTCAQLNTCYNSEHCKKGKFIWTSTDCLKADYALCAQQPNKH